MNGSSARSLATPWIAALWITTAGVVWAGKEPVTTSPGNVGAERAPASVAAACPTFSWGGAPGAKSYELTVRRTGEAGADAEPALSVLLPADATAWTPDLDDCLEPGNRYAWTARALLDDGSFAESLPRHFKVAPAMTADELEAAVEVIRKAFAERKGESAGVGLGAAPGLAAASEPEPYAVPPPLPPVAGDPDFEVDGSPVVTEATLGAALCATTKLRFLDQGDGTVLDCNTSLVWLKDAACPEVEPGGDGFVDWATATSFAASLADGMCGLADGSEPGDWRLPTLDEFCFGATPGSGICPASAAPWSLTDSSLAGDTKVLNARGDGPWLEDDAFVHLTVFNGFDAWWTATPFSASSTYFFSVFYGGYGSTSNDDLLEVWPVRSAR